MNKFKIGDRAYITSGNVGAVCGESLYEVEVIQTHGEHLCILMCLLNDVPQGQSFQGHVDTLYKNKNDAIDYMIKDLETFKDPIQIDSHVIRIERRKCPECQTEFSDIAGLVSTADGEEWHMTCNNRDCDYVLIQKVKREYEVIE